MTPYAVHRFDGALVATFEEGAEAAKSLVPETCVIKDGAVLRWHESTSKPAQKVAIESLRDAKVIRAESNLPEPAPGNGSRPAFAFGMAGPNHPRRKLSPMGDRFIRATNDRDNKHEEEPVAEAKTCKNPGCKKQLRPPRKGPLDPSVAGFCFAHRPKTGAKRARAGGARCTAPGCSNAPGAESKRPELTPLCEAHRQRVWKHEDNARRRGKPVPSIAEIVAPGQKRGPKPGRRTPVVRTKIAETKTRPPESDVASASALITRCLSAIARLGGLEKAERLAAALHE